MSQDIVVSENIMAVYRAVELVGKVTPFTIRAITYVPGVYQELSENRTRREVLCRVKTGAGRFIRVSVTVQQGDPKLNNKWYPLEAIIEYVDIPPRVFDFRKGTNPNNGLTLAQEVQALEGIGLQTVAELRPEVLPLLRLESCRIHLNHGRNGEHTVLFKLESRYITDHISMEVAEVGSGYVATEVYFNLRDGRLDFKRTAEGWQEL